LTAEPSTPRSTGDSDTLATSVRLTWSKAAVPLPGAYCVEKALVDCSVIEARPSRKSRPCTTSALNPAESRLPT
jgi:hypothetical protein